MLPRHLDQLTREERLVTIALRHTMSAICGSQPGAGSHLWTSFAPDCGATAARKASGALVAMIRQLACHAKSSISYHQALCPCLGPDELSLVMLIGLTQQRNWKAATSLVRTFVHEEGTGDVVAATAQFAAILQHHEIWLPARPEPQPHLATRPTVPANATVH